MDTEDARPMPARLPRGLIVLGALAAASITVAGLRGASGILGPIFLALVLTILVHPVDGSPCAGDPGGGLVRTF